MGQDRRTCQIDQGRRLVNTGGGWHPFHIHVNDFQVISVNSEPLEPHSWEDTTSISAFGEVVIRSRFLDFMGKTVYHCHVLPHEDRGMMGIVEIDSDARCTHD